MDNLIPVWVTGGSLIALGLFLIRRHVLTWRKQQASSGMSPEDLNYFRRQHRRRMQTSGLLALIGVLMIVGGVWTNDQRQPVLLLVWLLALLVLVFWVILLALGDWIAIRAHAQAALTEVKTQQYALQREADRLRGRVHSNGDRHPESEP